MWELDVMSERSGGMLGFFRDRALGPRRELQAEFQKTTAEKMRVEADLRAQGAVVREHQKTLQEVELETWLNDRNRLRSVVADARGGKIARFAKRQDTARHRRARPKERGAATGTRNRALGRSGSGQESA
jgi:hypothetical protein